MKGRFVFLPALFLILGSCGKNGGTPETGGNIGTEGDPVPEVMEILWDTSVLDKDMTERLEAFDEIQKYADACSDLTFKSYLEADDRLASSLETGTEILACYDAAFSRVLEGIRNETPAECISGCFTTWATSSRPRQDVSESTFTTGEERNWLHIWIFMLRPTSIRTTDAMP